MSLADGIRQVQAADAALQAAGPLPFPVPLQGLEAVVVGGISALERGDWWCPGLRERAGAVLRGVPLDRLMDGFRGVRPYKVAPCTESPALRALMAVGLAAGTGRPALVHLGIGSAADGAFTEALNLAAIQSVPALFLVAIHPLGPTAPVGPQLAANLETLGRAYGLPVFSADGSRAGSVFSAVQQARSVGGPALVLAPLIPGSDPVALA